MIILLDCSAAENSPLLANPGGRRGSVDGSGNGQGGKDPRGSAGLGTCIATKNELDLLSSSV